MMYHSVVYSTLEVKSMSSLMPRVGTDAGGSIHEECARCHSRVYLGTAPIDSGRTGFLECSTEVPYTLWATEDVLNIGGTALSLSRVDPEENSH